MARPKDPLPVRAARLYKPYRFGYRKVAKRLGVTEATVRRWLDPKFKERSARRSREAKRRHVGVCQRCGGPTRYNRNYPNRVSPICGACHQRAFASPEAALARRRYTDEDVIAAIQDWARAHEGVPPKMNDWIAARQRPSIRVVIDRYGSWNKGIAAAGFPTRKPSNQLPVLTGKRQEGDDQSEV